PMICYPREVDARVSPVSNPSAAARAGWKPVTLAGMLLLSCVPARAVEWQWSVPVDSVVSPETNDHPRAFLWIPPTSQRVRAVVVGQHNMLEEGIFEHPILRRTLSNLGIAVVWVSPGFDVTFDFNKGAGETFDAM